MYESQIYGLIIFTNQSGLAELTAKSDSRKMKASFFFFKASLRVSFSFLQYLCVWLHQVLLAALRSVVAVHQPSSCGPGLSCAQGMGILAPRPGIEPVTLYYKADS